MSLPRNNDARRHFADIYRPTEQCLNLLHDLIQLSSLSLVESRQRRHGGSAPAAAATTTAVAAVLVVVQNPDQK